MCPDATPAAHRDRCCWWWRRWNPWWRCAPRPLWHLAQWLRRRHGRYLGDAPIASVRSTDWRREPWPEKANTCHTECFSFISLLNTRIETPKRVVRRDVWTCPVSLFGSSLIPILGNIQCLLDRKSTRL